MVVHKEYQNRATFKEMGPQDGRSIPNQSISWGVMSIEAAYLNENPRRVPPQLALESLQRPTTGLTQ